MNGYSPYELIPQVASEVSRVQVLPEPPQETSIEPHVSNTPPLQPRRTHYVHLDLRRGPVELLFGVELVEWGHEEANCLRTVTSGVPVEGIAKRRRRCLNWNSCLVCLSRNNFREESPLGPFVVGVDHSKVKGHALQQGVIAACSDSSPSVKSNACARCNFLCSNNRGLKSSQVM